MQEAHSKKPTNDFNDEIDLQEEIGKIKTDENQKTELHFEIWKGNVKQNPSLWISKK